ncbi:hypothetical protein FRB96_003761 [Tulasnella sp. 330]|nr:hypothetical protein FRB96_003761 [Tulasnella sp. 330]KAG8879915.1 hypothetical protein FRB98_005449 [Tulasnella sp. 332]
MVQVNFVYANTGGLVDLYLDGALWTSVNTYANEDVTACDQDLVVSNSLPDGLHTLVVTNADSSSRTHLTGFVYSPSSTSTPATFTPAPTSTVMTTSMTPVFTSTSSQSNSPQKSHSIIPIIASVVGAVVVLIALVILAVCLIRRRPCGPRSTRGIHDANNASLAMRVDNMAMYQAVSLHDYGISHSPVSPPASSPGFSETSSSDYPPQSPVGNHSQRTSLLRSNRWRQERSSMDMDSFGRRGSTGLAQEQVRPVTQRIQTPEKRNPNRMAEDVGSSSSADGRGDGGTAVGWGPPPAYGDEQRSRSQNHK